VSPARADGDSISSSLPRLVRAARTPYGLAVSFLLLGLLGIASWNEYWVRHYVGYDFADHFAYAKTLVYTGHLPSAAESGEYYTPPLFYAVFGSVMRFAWHFGSSRPDKVARALNVPLVLGTAVLVLWLARMLWPTRRRLQLFALAFFVFLPVAIKTTSMFHPEIFSLFLSTLAVALAARMILRDDYRVRNAIGLGATLGAAQLVRAFTLWTFGTVVVVLLLVAWTHRDRRRVLRATALVVAATAVLTGPWYVRQAIHYSNPVFAASTEQAPLWRRRPVSFYTALGLPKSLSDPVRPNFTNDFLPTVYSDVWGDYFGSWLWGYPTPPPPDVQRQLEDQNLIGLLPTLLAIVGVVGILVGSARRGCWRDDPARLLAGILPVAGVLGFLYFTVGHPTSDGDVIKASYLLTTAPGWALGFGWALDRLTGDRLVAAGLGLLLVGSAVVDLGFLIFNTPLTGAF
jgi:hypothetical protein